MAEWDIYGKKDIHIKSDDGSEFVVGGSARIPRDPTLGVMWIAPVQMAQLAPGMKWCSCCGEVRPVEMFNPIVLEPEVCELLLFVVGAEIKLLRFSSTLLDLTAWLPKQLFKWCIACQRLYAPETMGLQYCPRCQMWRDPSDFYTANSWLCIEHEKERKNDAYRDSKESIGGTVRSYAR